MAERKFAPKEPEGLPGVTWCAKCDPSLRDIERLEEQGISLAQARHAHYLEYHDTQALAAHLRESIEKDSSPAHGYSFEGWLNNLLSWHRQKRVWIAADQRRFPEAQRR